ncbi:hypothetical protein D3C72_1791130 [compost metagenome]
MGEVDLVAVTGLDVLLDAFDRLAILPGTQICIHRRLQPERLAHGNGWLAEQLDQALTFAVGQRRVEHQLAGGLLVIADQRPVVQAEPRIRQMQVIQGPARQVFQVAAKIVAQVADQATGERQVIG